MEAAAEALLPGSESESCWISLEIVEGWRFSEDLGSKKKKKVPQRGTADANQPSLLTAGGKSKPALNAD